MVQLVVPTICKEIYTSTSQYYCRVLKGGGVQEEGVTGEP